MQGLIGGSLFNAGEAANTKESGTSHEHCFADPNYCCTGIVWIVTGSEKLIVLLDTLFFSKALLGGSGIADIGSPLLVFDDKIDDVEQEDSL